MPASEPIIDVDLRTLREETADVPESAPSLVKREEQFVVRYKTPEGTVHEDPVLSRIPNRDEKAQMSRITARLAGGTWANLPPLFQIRCYQIARFAVQVKNPPEWLDKWVQEDDVLLAVVVEQLEVHENRYFRRDGGTGAEGEGQQTVVIRPIGALRTSPE